MLGPSCCSTAQDFCAMPFMSAAGIAAAFGISRSMMYFGIGVIRLVVEFHSWDIADTAVAYLHETRGFQLAKMPLGFSFHTHAWRPHSWNVSFCLNRWPNSTGGAEARLWKLYGMMYSTATRRSSPSSSGSYSSSSGLSTCTDASMRATLP